ncbi:hypothetical protein ACFPIJ_61465 [Dactylosporangium cerinum]|uniref:DUF1444 family protein n=1 Tax=Dactylosporangium cerinum TaxID=1434730 RepID=A0ABV9WI45_9ACTN
MSSKKDFAGIVLAAIRAAGVADAQYQPDQFTIAVRRDSPDESPTHIYLGNLYSECDGVEPDERDERVAAFVAAVLDVSETPDTWDEAWPLLRPLMRPTTHHLAVADTIEHVRRPAWPFVSEYIVVDLPTKMAFVTTKDLDQWGVPEALVFDQAHHNMSGSAQATAADLTAESKQLIRLVDDGNAYWASHLFVDGWLAAVAPEDGGRPLFFVPDTTGALLVGTSPDDGPDDLAPVFELIESQYREAARPISPVAYTVDDTGAVVPFTVPAGHPLHAITHRSEVLLAAQEYAAQAEHLEQFEFDDPFWGDDLMMPFVAQYGVGEQPDGSVFSAVSWADRVDTLLPRADIVAFGSDGPDGPEVFFVAWDDVVREVGLVPDPAFLPERFRLRTWPPPEVVERLRRVAVEL